MGYIQWFINSGYKQYSVPFLFGILITSGVLLNIEEIINAPLIIGILVWVSCIGFDVGIAFHSYLTYKNNK